MTRRLTPENACTRILDLSLPMTGRYPRVDPPANLLGISVWALSHQLRVLRERGAASRESDGL